MASVWVLPVRWRRQTCRPDFPRALLRAMSAITADVNVQSRGLLWLGECSDADDEFRVVAAPIIAAAMRAHPDILRVQLLAVQSIHALIANGKTWRRPTIREAVLRRWPRSFDRGHGALPTDGSDADDTPIQGPRGVLVSQRRRLPASEFSRSTALR